MLIPSLEIVPSNVTENMPASSFTSHHWTMSCTNTPSLELRILYVSFLNIFSMYINRLITSVRILQPRKGECGDCSSARLACPFMRSSTYSTASLARLSNAVETRTMARTKILMLCALCNSKTRCKNPLIGSPKVVKYINSPSDLNIKGGHL